MEMVRYQARQTSKEQRKMARFLLGGPKHFYWLVPQWVRIKTCNKELCRISEPFPSSNNDKAFKLQNGRVVLSLENPSHLHTVILSIDASDGPTPQRRERLQRQIDRNERRQKRMEDDRKKKEQEDLLLAQKQVHIDIAHFIQYY